MEAVNVSRNVTLADRAALASSMWQRMVGLLGRNRLGEGEALVIQPCNSVHTLLMRFPIDVIFLDKRERVVKMVPEMAPFRFSPLVLKAATVIELPAGTIGRSGTQLEDHVTFRKL